jgi:hypothetical protein
MLDLDAPHRPLPRDLLGIPGGFLWWYVDVVNANGDGVVVIWSWGLPFLPGRADAARRGVPTAPQTAPSIHLTAYRAGQPCAYHLLIVEDATWRDGAWSFGASTLTFERDADGLTDIRASLRFPVPGSDEPLIATVTARGATPRYDAPDPPSDAHRWAPMLAPGPAHARLVHGDAVLLEVNGIGYHDRNGCPKPLHNLGLAHWVWGRVSTPTRTLIAYLSFPDANDREPLLLVADLRDDGTTTFHRPALSLPEPARATYGMPWWSAWHLALPEGEVVLHLAPPIDDGPFYLRHLLHATLDGRPAHGFAEACRPDRVDTPWMRPLVRMCVQPASGPGSWWLPLFAGPRRGRWRRLLAWWWSRRRRGTSCATS